MKYYQILITGAFLVGLLTWKSIKPTYLRAIVLMLGITALNEDVVVPYLKVKRIFDINAAYNIYSLVDMFCWFYVFYMILKEDVFKNYVRLAAIICMAYSLIELCLLKNWRNFHTDSLRLYYIFCILFVLRYFYLIQQKEYHLLYTDPLFFVATGVILYCSITFINFTTVAEHNYWNVKNARQVFHILQDVANSLYYPCLSTSFLVCYFSRYRKRQVYYPDS